MHELEIFYLGFITLLLSILIISVLAILIRYKLRNNNLSNWAKKNNLKYINGVTSNNISSIIWGINEGNRIFIFSYSGLSKCRSVQEEQKIINRNSFFEIIIDFLGLFVGVNPIANYSVYKFFGYTFINGKIYKPNILTKGIADIKMDELMNKKEEKLYNCERISNLTGNGTSEEIYVFIIANIFMNYGIELECESVKKIVGDLLIKINIPENKLLDLWHISQENISKAIELVKKNNYSIDNDNVVKVLDFLVALIRDEHESSVASIKKEYYLKK